MNDGGSRGDSYDNAPAESVVGVYKTDVVDRRGPWRTVDAVELATLDCGDLFNHPRLRGPLGDLPPVACEEQYYRRHEALAMMEGVT